MNKNINVNELQAKISGILKEVQNGTVYEVMRYSEPVAVVLAYDQYLRMKGECHHCIEELKQIAKHLKKKKEK
jgi:prevent-host-death family protein